RGPAGRRLVGRRLAGRDVGGGLAGGGRLRGRDRRRGAFARPQGPPVLGHDVERFLGRDGPRVLLHEPAESVAGRDGVAVPQIPAGGLEQLAGGRVVDAGGEGVADAGAL